MEIPQVESGFKLVEAMYLSYKLRQRAHYAAPFAL